MLTAQGRQARSRLANATARASRSPQDEAAQAAARNAKRDYAAIALEARIADVVASAPALTMEQQARLVALLRPIPTAGDAA